MQIIRTSKTRLIRRQPFNPTQRTKETIPLPHLTPILLQQGFQVGEQGRAELRMPETELDAGRNEAGGIAEVVADAIMDYHMDRVALKRGAQRRQ